jgi:uncharacterized protein YbaR (Trm112 family)
MKIPFRPSLERQTEQGQLVCPRTRQPLRLAGDRLESATGDSRYPIIDGVPVLFSDPARATGYLAQQDGSMAAEYTGDRRSPLRRAWEHLAGRVGDMRSPESEAAFRSIFAGLPEGALCLSVGGGPIRVHPALVNVNIKASTSWRTPTSSPTRRVPSKRFTAKRFWNTSSFPRRPSGRCIECFARVAGSSPRPPSSRPSTATPTIIRTSPSPATSAFSSGRAFRSSQRARAWDPISPLGILPPIICGSFSRGVPARSQAHSGRWSHSLSSILIDLPTGNHDRWISPRRRTFMP